MKRILAIAGVVFLLSLYLIAFICAFLKHPDASQWLAAALFSTVLVPSVMYAFFLVYRVIKNRNK